MMDLKDIDLNLLVVFNYLLTERSVSGAAAKLNLTQPAVSNALKRLRTVTGDELFIRTSKGMEPTPYASLLAEPISYALSTLHETLNQRTSFAPATSQRKFVVAMTDLGEITMLPELMHALKSVAPGITVNTVRNSHDSLGDELEAGHVDLAIGLLPQLKTGFFQQRLFMQKHVCLMRRGHPLDGNPVSKDNFFKHEHVQVVSAGTGHTKIDEIIDNSYAAKRKVRLMVPHFVAVGHIIATTDLIASVPELYARQYAEPFNLTYVNHPLPLPKFGINLFWHAKFHKEPGNQWLRKLIFNLFSEGIRAAPEDVSHTETGYQRQS